MLLHGGDFNMYASAMFAMLDKICNFRLTPIPERKQWLHDLVRDPSILKEFRLLKTDEERVKHSLKTLLKGDTNRWFDFEWEQKNTSRSIELRDEGHESYTLRRFEDSVREYTGSIVCAESSSKELALAFSHRSAALYQLKKYEDCIKDIDRALKLEYPDRLKSALYLRKGSCLKSLGIPDDAESSFKEALVWNERRTASKDVIKSFKVKLENLISAPPAPSEPPTSSVQYPVKKILTPNPVNPSLSDAVTIEYSKKFGRHLVATRDIEPGELIILEKPYCSRVKYAHLFTHCSHCLQESWSLIPCKYCVNVAYCSETCMNEAWDEYHEVECPVVELLANFRIKSQHWISVKMVLMATKQGKQVASVKEELKKVDCHSDPRTKGFGKDGKFDSAHYRSAYSLFDTADKCSTQQTLLGSLWASLTVCMMARETNMFGKKLTIDHALLERPDVIFIGQLILKNLFIVSANIYGYGPAVRDLNDNFGSGILPLCSLINHSCDPNTARMWHIDRMAFHAIYPINKGEQIFDNYGTCCSTMPEYERRVILENWKFTCECLPCTENWPLLRKMPSYKKQATSRQNKHQLEVVMLKLMVTYRSLLQKSNIENLTNMLNELLKAIESFLKLAKKPCKELYMLVNAVQEFYRSGNTIYDYDPANPESEVPPGLLEFHQRLQDVLL